jgi:hypothetical protein
VPTLSSGQGEHQSLCGRKGILPGEGDKIKLDRSHAYYYQIQAQLFILQVDYCDFIVWNKNYIFIERILPDVEFSDSITPKAESFFQKCILPEVLAKKFTKQVSASLLSTSRSP